VDAGVVCAPSFEPTGLTVRVLNPEVSFDPPSTAPSVTVESRDLAAVKDIAAAACALPEPPDDIMCAADFGPSYELRFATRDETATVRAESFGCGYVTGLGPRRYHPRPLWDALAQADLPHADRG
jgi:hypothetical protein